MASAIASLIAGLVFGLGLILSGMGNPAKVQNFLDFFGAWDPSLAFVMGAPFLWAWWRSPGPASARPRCWETPCSCPPPPRWTNAC